MLAEKRVWKEDDDFCLVGNYGQTVQDMKKVRIYKHPNVGAVYPISRFSTSS